MWLEEWEEIWDACQKDDLLWGNSIMDLVMRVMVATDQGQKEISKMITNGVGLEASMHTDFKQWGELEQREGYHQAQPRLQLKPARK